LFYSVVFNWLELYVQKRVLEHSLARHLPPKRIKELVRRPELLRPGAEKQMLSIMFTDIANFTTFSEGMDSNDLARAMNEYFETALPCVHEAEGWVVKLIGDSIFAFWNAPEQQPRHRELACRAAIRLRDQVLHFSGDESGIKLKTRIGLHTGLANVGNFGSATRIDYTALGESINLASRMEGLNKHLGTDILITRETREGASETITTRFAGHFRLKGFDKAVEVYELIGLRDDAEPTPAWHATFELALRDFAQTDFDAAERGFRCTLEMRPGDGPAQFYLRQMAELRVHAPATGWSGEIALKEK
jgi:adenylate cyclase